MNDDFEISPESLKALDEMLGRHPGAVHRLSDFTPKGKEFKQLKQEIADPLARALAGDLGTGAADMLAGFLVDAMVNVFVKASESETDKP